MLNSLYSFLIKIFFTMFLSKFSLFYFFVAERNWNMTLPGFGGDEIKSFRKPVRIIIDQLPLS
jgi:hypothetical protein